MIYGYKRPIISDRNIESQLNDLVMDVLFIESHPFAKKRTALDELLMKLKPGDEVYVQNIEVIADSLNQLADILRVADKDAAVLFFIDEGISSKGLPAGGLYEAAAFFSSIQSTCLKHATVFGIQEAKKQGKIMGRPKKSDDNLKKAFDMYQSRNYTLAQIKEATGISKSTLYRYIDTASE